MCSVGQHIDLQCARHIQSKKHSLNYTFLQCTSLAQAAAATSLFVALKLENCVTHLPHLANMFASTCYESLSRPQRSEALVTCFGPLKEMGNDEKRFKAAWKVLLLC
jgi:hypothetical protein